MSTDIILVSNEGVPVLFSRKGADLMQTITNLIEDLGESDDPIPVPMVDTSTLEDVLTYTDKYLSATFVETPEGEVRMLSEWELEFFNGNWSRVQNIILAANFLQYDLLIQACAQFIASQIVKMTPAEIKEYCSS